MTSHDIDTIIAERGSCPQQIDGVHVDITRSCFPYRYGYSFVWRGESYSGDGALTPLAARYGARLELVAIKAAEQARP